MNRHIKRKFRKLRKLHASLTAKRKRWYEDKTKYPPLTVKERRRLTSLECQLVELARQELSR